MMVRNPAFDILNDIHSSINNLIGLWYNNSHVVSKTGPYIPEGQRIKHQRLIKLWDLSK